MAVMGPIRILRVFVITLPPFPMRAAWQPKLAALQSAPWLEQIDFLIATDQLEMAGQTAKIDIEPVHITKHQIEDVVAFLQSLTGENAKQGRLGRPDTVHSGLTVD